MKRTVKKILSCIAFALAIFSLSVLAKDEPTAMSEEAVNTVKLLEIANGDQNGNMNYQSKVTRAEFVKMAISASTGKSLAANTKLDISLFPDVRSTYWGASYISVALDNGLVNGYLDGTFKPGNNVTLEEAVTIVLRLLGYKNEDFVGNYPSSQLAKYKDLKLDENINAKQGETLKREECMILLYNALSAKTKSGSVYCTTLGYSANSEGKIDYSALLQVKLDGPYIVKDSGNCFDGTSFKENSATSYTLNNISSSRENIEKNDVIYTSDIINAVFVYRKNATGVVSSVSSASVSLGNKTYSLSTSSAKEKLSLGGKYSEEKAFVTLLLGIDDAVVDVFDGDISLIDENTDNATYIEMIESTISSPIYLDSDEAKASWKEKVPFDVEDAVFYVNGKKTSAYSENMYDVVYYSKQFCSIWVYRDTQSGILNSVNTNSIVVGSKTYSLATNDAKYKVSTYGEYDVDDYITLVLGKNDEVIDIRSADTFGIGTTENDSSYSEVVQSSLKGPYVVSSDLEMSNLTIDLNSAGIYYENALIDKDEIQPYDVYYYSKVLDIIWIYRDKVSGTIEAVSPASSPTSVTLSGTTYTIANSQASYDLSTFGSFNIGDKATLLLGMDDKVAGVVTPDNASSVLYGVVTGRGEKTYTDKNGELYTSNYVTVTDTSAKEHTYQYASNRFTVGDIVRVTVGTNIQISAMSDNIGKGAAASLVKAFKNGDFAENCNIIDVSGTDVIKVYPERLSGIELDVSMFTYSTVVMYYNFDENGMLTDLILKDFTGDIDKYGVVTSNKNGNVTYLDSSVEKSFSGSGCSAGPAKLIVENGLVVASSSLNGCIDNIDVITENYIVDENGVEYKFSDDLNVFIKTSNTTYTYSEIGDVLNGKYSFKAYYDKLPKYGGRIRVIIATRIA